MRAKPGTPKEACQGGKGQAVGEMGDRNVSSGPGATASVLGKQRKTQQQERPIG